MLILYCTVNIQGRESDLGDFVQQQQQPSNQQTNKANKQAKKTNKQKTNKQTNKKPPPHKTLACFLTFTD